MFSCILLKNCSERQKLLKTVAKKVPIEHNRDRPSRESVKEPQRSSLRRPGDYFPFVNTQKKGDTWDVRVIIGK